MIDPILKPAPTSASSQQVRAVGKFEQDATGIFIYEDVLEEILDFSESDLQRETGGFLIGNFYRDPNHQYEFQYIEIEHFLPATAVRSNSASLTFTHDTWSAVNQEVNLRHSDQRILGWQHTHPGLGVFLSAYDLFIHRNFFASPWQVAMVVDPCQHEFGFFQWHQDRVRNCAFACISNPVRIPQSRETDPRAS